MFVGHALLAFIVVAAVGHWRGWGPGRAMLAGVVAGLFATTPDLDILYGPVGLLGGVSGIEQAAESFWATGNVVHRGPTHSLVVAAVAALAFGAWSRRTVVSRTVALAVLVGIAGTVAAVSGLLAAVVTTVFLLGGILVSVLAVHWDVRPGAVALAALVGLGTHPFGDLFTGTPPHLLYPFDVSLVTERIVLHPDPTLNLLGAFGVELAVVWVALALAFALRGDSIRTHVDRRAVLGFGYGAVALALPAPTLETSYHFVFSVLAVGVVAVPRRRLRRVDVPRVACTALAMVTCAAVAYGAAYLLF